MNNTKYKVGDAVEVFYEDRWVPGKYMGDNKYGHWVEHRGTPGCVTTSCHTPAEIRHPYPHIQPTPNPFAAVIADDMARQRAKYRAMAPTPDPIAALHAELHEAVLVIREQGERLAAYECLQRKRDEWKFKWHAEAKMANKLYKQAEDLGAKVEELQKGWEEEERIKEVYKEDIEDLQATIARVEGLAEDMKRQALCLDYSPSDRNWFLTFNHGLTAALKGNK